MKVLVLIQICMLISLTYAIFPHMKGEKEERVNVKQHVPPAARQRRSVTGESFPDELDINLVAEGKDVEIKLFRNPDVDENVPILVNDGGRFVPYKIPDDIAQGEEAAFYYATDRDCSFIVWHGRRPPGQNEEEHFKLFGTFSGDEADYQVQPSTEDDDDAYMLSRVPIEDGVIDYISTHEENTEERREVGDTMVNETTSDRKKRQTTLYEVELMMVVDYAVFLYWDGIIDPAAPNRNDLVLFTIKQFYNFIFNTMNARYKSVQGQGFIINVLCSGITIAQTSADAPYIEDNIWAAASGSDPAKADVDVVLPAFRDWANDNLAESYDYDHAAMFTRYDIGKGNGTTFRSTIIGYAYVGGICGANRYSINEDHYDAKIGTVVSHELGHNLGAAHDESGNACNGGAGYIMAPTVGLKLDDFAFNRRKYVFSSCSIMYFGTTIDALNLGSNCMLTRSGGYNPNLLDDFIGDLAGQVYPPDDQCVRLRGNGSFLARYSYDNYEDICPIMKCTASDNYLSYWVYHAWDGTTCASGKVCVNGSCVNSASAPTNLSATCVFGSMPGLYPDTNETCAQYVGPVQNAYRCYSSRTAKLCCEECDHHREFPVAGQEFPPDDQCAYLKGNGSFLARHAYDNDEDICPLLRCTKPENYLYYTSRQTWDGTTCASGKICVNGSCVNSASAPTNVSATCVFGSMPGLYPDTNETCAQYVGPVQNAYRCYSSRTAKLCCEECDHHREFPVAGQEFPPDDQCAYLKGNGSFLARHAYDNDEDICPLLRCTKPENYLYYTSRQTWDGTTCASGKICVNGSCVNSASAPTNVSATCVFGSMPGLYPDTNETCAQYVGPVQNAYRCYSSRTAKLCCEECDIHREFPVAGQEFPPDDQCAYLKGNGSFLARHAYDNDEDICPLLWCTKPENYLSYTGRQAWDGTTCASGKICVNGSCVNSASAPTNVSATCVFGSMPGLYPDTNETCAQYVGPVQNAYRCYSSRTAKLCCEECDHHREFPVAGQEFPPDDQCAYLKGNGSFLARHAYDNDEDICPLLRCTKPENYLYYTSRQTWDGTTCASGKICVNGSCVNSASAPTNVSATCVFGSMPGLYPDTNETCAQYVGPVQNAYRCYSSRTAKLCCEECDHHREFPVAGQEFPPDDQCAYLKGNGSFLARHAYDNDEDICPLLWCTKPENYLSYTGRQAWDGTTCASGKICVNGSCVNSASAPTNVSATCMFGSMPGLYPDTNETCAQYARPVENAYRCYNSHTAKLCCEECDIHRHNFAYIPGCEFGDQVNNCHQGWCIPTHSQYCCVTCYVASTTTQISFATMCTCDEILLAAMSLLVALLISVV